MTPTQEYLIEGISADVVDLLIQECHMTLSEAIATYHNSETFAKLSDPDTGLYIESSRYIFNMLKRELTHGRLVP